MQGSRVSNKYFEEKEFRDALGRFATGVTIISSVGRNQKLIGITANSFSSVSLDPPLVLFSLGRKSQNWYEFLSTQYFAVNVLNDQQSHLSTHFARSSDDKWSGIDYEVWDTGCPIVPGAIAVFECEYRYTHDGGDHVIFVGEVLRLKCDMHARPLLFYRGGYAQLPTNL